MKAAGISPEDDIAYAVFRFDGSSLHAACTASLSWIQSCIPSGAPGLHVLLNCFGINFRFEYTYTYTFIGQN